MSKKRLRIRWIVLILVSLGLLGTGGVYLLWPTSAPTLRADVAAGCWGVANCADDCSQRCPDDPKKFNCMLGCASRCEARGCPGATEYHERLTSCVMRRCLRRCLGGPSPDCKRCTMKRCKAESDRCEAHRCGDERK